MVPLIPTCHFGCKHRTQDKATLPPSVLVETLKRLPALFVVQKRVEEFKLYLIDLLLRQHAPHPYPVLKHLDCKVCVTNILIMVFARQPIFI